MQIAVAELATFEEFVRSHSRRLLRAAWLLTGDWALAEDLVQAALVAAWQRWQVDVPNAPQAYVDRILLNKYIRERRRARWTREVLTESPPDAPSQASLGDSDARATLATALNALAPRQRAVIVCRFFLDLTEKDTSSALGCSVGAVKSHTASALKRLRSSPLLQDMDVS